MASGGTDGSVRLWDLQHHSCTHNLKEIQGVTRYLFYILNKMLFSFVKIIKHIL